MEPVEAPAEVRAGGAAGFADGADGVAFGHAVADFHVEARHVQIAGRDAAAVVEDDRAAGEIEIVFGHRDDRADRARGSVLPSPAAMSTPKCGRLGTPFRMRWLP